jgi:hypothetical protein
VFLWLKDLKSVTTALPEADASYQASRQVLIAKARQVVDAAFEEQVSAAAERLRTVVDSITATKGCAGNGQP